MAISPSVALGSPESGRSTLSPASPLNSYAVRRGNSWRNPFHSVAADVIDDHTIDTKYIQERLHAVFAEDSNPSSSGGMPPRERFRARCGSASGQCSASHAYVTSRRLTIGFWAVRRDVCSSCPDDPSRSVIGSVCASLPRTDPDALIVDRHSASARIGSPESSERYNQAPACSGSRRRRSRLPLTRCLSGNVQSRLSPNPSLQRTPPWRSRLRWLWAHQNRVGRRCLLRRR